MNGILCAAFLFSGELIARGQKGAKKFVGKLSDGTQLRIRQVTFGTNILDLRETGEVTRVDPKKLGKRFRPEEALRVWASVWPKRDNPKFTRWILSDAGQHFPQGSYTKRKIGNRDEYGVIFKVFPRRDREFVFKGTVDGEEFAVRIPNPIPESTEFTSFAVNQEFEIKLKRIRIRTWERGNIPRPSVSPVFQVLRQRMDVTHWFDIRHYFEDATGNRGSVLPLNEDFWRLRVAIFKNEKAEWRTNEFISIKPDKLPGPGEMQVHRIDRTFNGRRIDTLLLAGPGNYIISNNIVLLQEEWSKKGRGNGGGESDDGHAYYEYSYRDRLWAAIISDGKGLNDPWHRQMPLQALDSAGSRIPVMFESGGGVLKLLSSRYTLDIPEDPGSIEFRIAPQIPIEAEFLIDPKNPPTERTPARTSDRFIAKLADDKTITISRIAFGTNAMIYIDDRGEAIRLEGAMIDSRFAGHPNKLTIFTQRSRGLDVGYQWRSETGQEFLSVGHGGSRSVDKQFYNLIQLEVFPRHLPEFKLDGHANKQPFSFNIPNPLHPLKVFTPLKAASTTTNGIEFRLKSFEIKESHEQLHAISHVTAFRDGKPVRGIESESVFSDVYGNRGSMLSTNSLEWKIETTSHKSSAYDWPEGSFVSFEPQDIPAPARVAVHEFGREIDGMKIDRLVLGGPGSFILSNGITLLAEHPHKIWRGGYTIHNGRSWRLTHTSREPWLQVMTSGGIADRKLIVFARNADGSIIPLKSRGRGSGGGYSYHRFYFPDPGSAKPGWTIGFATSLPMHAEFVVDIRPTLRRLAEQRVRDAQHRKQMEAYRQYKARQEKK